jgi:hypothetical protein
LSPLCCVCACCHNCWKQEIVCHCPMLMIYGEVYSIQHYMIKFVSDLWQICNFLCVLRFPPRYSWNIVESGVKHHKPNQPCLLKENQLEEARTLIKLNVPFARRHGHWKSKWLTKYIPVGLLVLAYQLVLGDQVGLLVPYLHFLPWLLLPLVLLVYSSLFYNYMCNQCLSPPTLWVRTQFMAKFTQYNIIW